MNDSGSFRENNSLFVRKFDLEANDITVLNFALSEGHLWLHDLYHPRLYFLRSTFSFGDLVRRRENVLRIGGEE